MVAVDAEYPEGWSIRLLRLVAQDGQVVSEVEVPMEDIGVLRVPSFWTVSEGIVVRAREYWTVLGADEAPARRRSCTDPM